jgi:hypothetical protein
MKSGFKIIYCYYCDPLVLRGWGRANAHNLLWYHTFLPIVLFGLVAIFYAVTYKQTEMAAVMLSSCFCDVTLVPCFPKLTRSCSGLSLSVFKCSLVWCCTFAKRVWLLENTSVASAQWRPGVSAGTSKLMKIRHRDLLLSQSSTACVSS